MTAQTQEELLAAQEELFAAHVEHLEIDHEEPLVEDDDDEDDDESVDEDDDESVDEDDDESVVEDDDESVRNLGVGTRSTGGLHTKPQAAYREHLQSFGTGIGDQHYLFGGGCPEMTQIVEQARPEGYAGWPNFAQMYFDRQTRMFEQQRRDNHIIYKRLEHLNRVRAYNFQLEINQSFLDDQQRRMHAMWRKGEKVVVHPSYVDYSTLPAYDGSVTYPVPPVHHSQWLDPYQHQSQTQQKIHEPLVEDDDDDDDESIRNLGVGTRSTGGLHTEPEAAYFEHLRSFGAGIGDQHYPFGGGCPEMTQFVEQARPEGYASWPNFAQALFDQATQGFEQQRRDNHILYKRVEHWNRVHAYYFELEINQRFLDDQQRRMHAMWHKGEKVVVHPPFVDFSTLPAYDGSVTYPVPAVHHSQWLDPYKHQSNTQTQSDQGTSSSRGAFDFSGYMDHGLKRLSEAYASAEALKKST